MPCLGRNLYVFLHRPSGRCAESDNHLRRLFYHFVQRCVYNDYQIEHTCLSAFAGKLNFSSRDESPARADESRQTDNNEEVNEEKFSIMEIKRSGSQPSGKGPSEYFTGTVRLDPLFQAPDPARVAGASVTFEPGARTAWHTHPMGQTLIVTAGCGRAQRWGGPIEEIRPGDVIWFSPGEKHWHGATPTTAMTHIAIQERLDGKTVDWMEKVSDEQYQG
jgi:quercetin dioxygenase-like cupin family protein